MKSITTLENIPDSLDIQEMMDVKGGAKVFCKKDQDIILHKLVDSGLTPSYISTKVPINVSIAEKLYKTGYNNVIQISLDILDEDKLIDLIEYKKGYLKSIKDGINILQEYGFKIQISACTKCHIFEFCNLKLRKECNLLEMSVG